MPTPVQYIALYKKAVGQETEKGQIEEGTQARLRALEDDMDGRCNLFGLTGQVINMGDRRNLFGLIRAMARMMLFSNTFPTYTQAVVRIMITINQIFFSL